ncbi:MAG: S1C family serine protease [Eubacteriales bacterium]|nr:S1C family serine protease [Eubacteriales bacterium]
MEDNNKKKLINEKITGRKMTPGRVGKIMLVAGVCGVVFGVTAALAFNAVSINTERRAAASETTAANVETMMPETTSAGNEKTGEDYLQESTAFVDAAETISDDNEQQTSVSESETIDPEEERKEFSDSVLSVLKDSVKLADPYLVAVVATSQTSTWFDNEAEDSESYSGVILSIDEHEILILTCITDTEGRSFKVRFKNGNVSDAYIKNISVNDGLAIIAVSSTDGISEETLDSVTPVEYCNTEELSNGDSIIAIGAPLGAIGSTAFGYIGYIRSDEPGIDCEQQVIYSEIKTNSSKGTFIIDHNGKLIGIVSGKASESGINAGVSRIISIAAFDSTIKSLIDGNKMAYMGIMGIDVNFDMRYNNIPEGVYVEEVIQGSPAYAAGIRRGDIIVNLNNRDVSDMASFMHIMKSVHPEDEAAVKVMRGSVGDEYNSLEYLITFGER